MRVNQFLQHQIQVKFFELEMVEIGKFKISFPHSGIPKNGSVPSFNRVRKTSESGGYKPTLGTISDGANVRMDEKRSSVISLPASLSGSKYSLTNDEFVIVSRHTKFKIYFFIFFNYSTMPLMPFLFSSKLKQIYCCFERKTHSNIFKIHHDFLLYYWCPFSS